jgi:hypothetical protein
MENLELYINENGTYTSPKNGKEYKSLKAFRAHWYNAGTGGWSKVNSTKVECQYCQKKLTQPNLERHEDTCHLNPVNLQECIVCSKPIKNYKHSKGTCSRSCANKHFRSGEGNGMWSGNNYQLICWQHHKKECIVCGEDKIVAVHHNDHNHYNNDPENLIPLCPTHHQYVHSQYKDEVQPIIDKYVESRKTVSV